MTSAQVTAHKHYSSEQIQLWLRGLLSIAWADGQFEPTEKDMIRAMVSSEFAPGIDFDDLTPVEPEALKALNLSDAEAQNFLRMAVMVALADGVYSQAENDKVVAFSEALDIEPQALASIQAALKSLRSLDETANEKASGGERNKAEAVSEEIDDPLAAQKAQMMEANSKLAPLKPMRDWLDKMDVDDPRLARFVCRLVPSQCPFERDITLFGKKVVHVPPMCKLNPLYEQLVGLRFRALSYLADDLGEDVSEYV